MNIFAGGKLKIKNPTHAPSKLHATAAPKALSATPGIAAYPSAIAAVIPAANPSAPSKKLNAKTRAVMLLPSRERDLVIDAFRCGAHGVIFRDEPLETLSKCIHAVHQGQVWANSEHLGYLLDALGHAKPLHLQDARGLNLLSKREENVVRLVSEGLTNRQISSDLGLSEHTVRNYLFRIFDKLGVSTRVELVLYCLQDRPAAQVEMVS
jgi:DNA-binding NarL/FixJ family response regulator